MSIYEFKYHASKKKLNDKDTIKYSKLYIWLIEKNASFSRILCDT